MEVPFEKYNSKVADNEMSMRSELEIHPEIHPEIHLKEFLDGIPDLFLNLPSIK